MLIENVVVVDIIIIVVVVVVIVKSSGMRISSGSIAEPVPRNALGPVAAAFLLGWSGRVLET